MTRYLISFDDGAMTFPEAELPDVADAAYKVVQEADFPPAAEDPDARPVAVASMGEPMASVATIVGL